VHPIYWRPAQPSKHTDKLFIEQRLKLEQWKVGCGMWDVCVLAWGMGCFLHTFALLAMGCKECQDT
jgi:hypothetical protein